MCGIAGYSRSKRSSIPNGAKFAVHLAHGIESRGRHATGFGWFEAGDKGQAYYSKQKGSARQVAHTLALPKRGISVLTAHTRHFTKGHPSVYENNHPVVCDNIVATHNGRVDNDDELIQLAGAERLGMVDSFAIPAILAYASEIGASHPTELLDLIRGVAAIAWLDADEHDTLHLARLSTRPLHIGWTHRGDLVYSSTRQTLERSARAAKIRIGDIVEVKEGTYLRVEQGNIQEWVEFDVVHPPVIVQEDVPTPTPLRRSAPSAPVAPFNGSDIDWWAEYDRWEAERKAHHDELWEELTMDDDPMDDIDWADVLPRRGHKGYTP